MKATVTVMGIPWGEIEVGENSVVAQLARGEWQTAMPRIRALQAEIDELCHLPKGKEADDDD